MSLTVDHHEVTLSIIPASEQVRSCWLAKCSCYAFQHGTWEEVQRSAVGHLHGVLGQVKDDVISPGPIILTARLPEHEP